MKKVFVVTLLGLAAAGCAQSRSALTPADQPGPARASALGPVSLKPIPPIDETVNRGMGNSAVVRTAIKDPDDPRWSGRAPASAAASPPGAVAATGPGQGQPNLPGQNANPGVGTGASAATPAVATGWPAAAPAATSDPVASLPQPGAGAGGGADPRGLRTAAIPGAAPANPAADPQIETLNTPIPVPAPNAPRETLALPTPVSSPAPNSAAPDPAPSGALPGEPTGTSMGLPTTGPIPVPPEPSQTGARGLPAVPVSPETNPPAALMPGSADVAPSLATPGDNAFANPPSPLPSASSGIPPAPGGPQRALVDPASSLPPASSDAAPPRQARTPAADPLLGPNPELMPPLPDEPAAQSAPAPAPVANPGPAPAGKPAQATPAKPAAAPPAAVKPQVSKTPASPVRDASPAALPDLPELPEPPASGPAAASPPPSSVPLAAPAPIELETAPAPDSGDGSGAAAPASATPPANPAGAGGSASLTEPASAGSVAVLPPLEAAPPATAAPTTVAAVASSTSPSGSPRTDRQLVLASGETATKQILSPEPAKPATDQRRRVDLLEPGRPCAKVGEDIITYHDVMALVLQHRAYEQLAAAYTSGNAATKREVDKQLKMMQIAMLEDLINRSLLSQEAKRMITKQKDGAKMLDAVYEEADQRFRDVEVLPLQRKFNVDSEVQVREKLAEQGRSLPEMQKAFRQRFLGEMYLHTRIKDKVKVELPDMLKYYSEHARKHEFDRPALIVWREIVVEPPKAASPKSAPDDTKIPLDGESINRAVARGEAVALLDRLRRGEDFATLARKESDGPSASRNNGGLMETSPGGYGIPSVESALKSLPIGQVSDLIEGPDGFHIIKVEKRRPAGPASFEEVQNKIKPLIENEKWVAEQHALIAKLRKTSFIKIYSAKSKRPADVKPASS